MRASLKALEMENARLALTLKTEVEKITSSTAPILERMRNNSGNIRILSRDGHYFLQFNDDGAIVVYDATKTPEVPVTQVKGLFQ